MMFWRRSSARWALTHISLLYKTVGSSHTSVAFSLYTTSRPRPSFCWLSQVTQFPRGGSGRGSRGTTSSMTALAMITTTTTTTNNDKDESIIITSESSETETCSSSSSSSSYYEQLITKLEGITHLSRASSVLSYDQQVFMPASATAERGAQLAALAAVIHEQKTNPLLLELMNQALDETNDRSSSNNNTMINSKWNKKDIRRVVELEKKSFVENQRVPSELAAKAASLSATANAVWANARKANDFSMFSPSLQECFDTAIEITKAKHGGDTLLSSSLSSSSNDNVYSFMLDEFEMGMSQERMDTIFAEVQEALVPLISKVLNSTTPPSTKPLDGTFDIEKQKQLSEHIVKAIGYNAENGRIDVSVHPFTSAMSPNDVRITSRFREDDWYQGLAGSIHESGHAIYEQNLNPSALSIDFALTTGTHESQSLFWERHIGLSKPFWKWATPILKETFGEEQFDYSADQIYNAVNALSKESLIRVEADELRYPLHVILRYNIEKDVIGGRLKVQDIPQRWNDDMMELLNVQVPSDDKGCLQDIHWSFLAFGYFPTYLIGAIAAAQLFHYCRQDILNMDQAIEKGNFVEIKQWLHTKVHQHGRRHSSLDDLLNDQLGEPLNPKYFIEYLTNKFSDLYQL